MNSSETSTPEAVLKRIRASIEVGMTTFDHADIYGGYSVEELFGRALNLEPALKKKIEIVTKTGIRLISDRRKGNSIKSYDTSTEYVTSSVNNSLKVLGVERIDLLLIHRPDPLLDPDALANVFTELRKSGKVREFGVSNHSASQMDLLASRMQFPLVTNQVEISPFCMNSIENGTLDQCLKTKALPMAWSALGGGRLFQKELDPVSQRLIKAAQTILNRRQGSLPDAGVDHVMFAWLLAHPAKIVPVLGTGNLERIRCAPLAEDIKLSREEWFEIWQAAKGHEVP
jgi:predicted oxidoreductase